MNFLITVSTLGYFIGCFLLIPSSILLYFQQTYIYSISLFIISCGILFLSSIIDYLWFILDSYCKKPVVFEDDIQEEKIPDTSFCSSSVKLFFILLFYFLGGFLFLLGSIFFWPSLPSKFGPQGVWIFRFGSFSYMAGSFVVFYTLEEKSKKIIKVCSIISYLLGSCLYIIGGLLSQFKFGVVAFSTAWLVGSIFFFIGSLLALIHHLKPIFESFFNKNL